MKQAGVKEHRITGPKLAVHDTVTLGQHGDAVAIGAHLLANSTVAQSPVPMRDRKSVV